MTTNTTQVRINLHRVTRDGRTIGYVYGTDIYGGWVRASRFAGEPGVDINRASNFKSIAAAAAWISRAA